MIMNKQPSRQRLRKSLLCIMFLLLPVVFNYVSPALIIMGASEGILNGSAIVFITLFFSSLLVGRAFCGWVCPPGATQEVCRFANDTPARGGKGNWIKYGIWLIWMGIILAMAIRAGGYHAVNFLYMQPPSGISTMTVADYIRYYAIVGVIVAFTLLGGRRPMCHYFCWMAPFMIIGTAIKNAVKWPSLHLRANKDACINCKLCTKHCPMSLNVHEMAQTGSMKNAECILCGECVDNCPKQVISYSFGTPQ
ncbi:4Fe-4S ferredoxin, iron-sulfur binding [Candidatus Moduliflexus flocculans]|uniref:4Fe-4S ferredoxin, iron-sulfur binding n=1 Tax=Candidatus Moduliflexus flocculans TaxID=1499966 RepID=A0A081BPZ7_9BACT|nr:4Fe-4S ferredoxin, iron-sulfur binding [Candidatus Moduliflexus flocculans]